jgi:hypothetical protein
MLTVIKMFGLLILVYGGIVLMMAGWQRKMIYFPSHASEERLLKEAQAKGMSAWRNGDGELIGWQASSPGNGTGANAVVVFHGNGGYAGHRDYFIEGFSAWDDQRSWTIYIFEYPGYGARQGHPAEDRIKARAGEAVASLFDGYDRLFLVGESLGTGVATHLAGQFPEHIDGLLLITPFTSLVDVAKKHYPMFPVGLLMRERYDNLEPLKGYRGPVAFLIAGADEIIPPSLGRKLYEAYSGPKRLWVQEGRGHNTLDYDPGASWWKEAADFLQNSGGGR